MSKIDNLVRNVLDENGITHAPVDVEIIARSADAKISFEDFDYVDNISGMLFRDDKRTVIAINSNHHPNRQRFSIAHELGHLYLHTGDLFVDRVTKINATRHYRNEISSLAVDKKEIEANTFAANLLMPKQFIYDEISNIFDEDENISIDALTSKLSSVFEVSTSAMKYRLENLGILVSQE